VPDLLLLGSLLLVFKLENQLLLRAVLTNGRSSFEVDLLLTDVNLVSLGKVRHEVVRRLYGSFLACFIYTWVKLDVCVEKLARNSQHKAVVKRNLFLRLLAFLDPNTLCLL
jgi:hypothetical protein